MAEPLTLLVDNGSLAPAATLRLRGIAAAVASKIGRRVEAVSLLHSSAVPPENLGGVAAEIVEPAVLRADDADLCLERCLAQLGPGGRELLVRYYEEGGTARIDSRRALAEELGIPAGAVRNRVQRLRDRLEECVRSCLRARGRHGSPSESHG